MQIDVTEVIKSIGGLATAASAIGAFLFSGWKWIMKPIQNIKKSQDDNTDLLNINSKKLNETLNLINNKISPFMNSIQNEFNVNSGKTLRDQLTRIEDNLKTHDARIRSFAMNLSDVGLYECDRSGRCIWVNKAYSDLWGRESNELLDAGWLAAVRAEDREEVWDKWQYAVTHGTPYEAEYSILNERTGEETRVKTIATVFRGRQNNVMCYLGTVTKV